MKSVSSLESLIITEREHFLPLLRFLSALNPLGAFPAPCCLEETAKDTKATVVLEEGNTSLMETSPLSRPAGVLIRADGVN